MSNETCKLSHRTNPQVQDLSGVPDSSAAQRGIGARPGSIIQSRHDGGGICKGVNNEIQGMHGI